LLRHKGDDMNYGPKRKTWCIVPVLILLMEAILFPLMAISSEAQFTQNQPPTVRIVQPAKKGIYFKDLRLFPALRIVIFGYVTLRVNATDDMGVKRVEFYVDGVLRDIKTSPHSCGSYMWTWSERIWVRSHHTLKVVAVDTENLTSEITFDVIIHNFPLLHPFYP